MLEKNFHKDFSYTGVEVDNAIIYLASKYVLNDLSSEISLIHADAANFVLQNQLLYDMICIDIFVDDLIPVQFLTEEFLIDVKENLSQQGIILFNHLGHTKTDIKNAQNYYNDIFSKVFPEGKIMKVHKNYLMLSHTKDWLIS